MFKNVLIISDNKYLAEKFFDIVEKKKFHNCNFSLAISPFSNIDDFKFHDIEVNVYDLKKAFDIDLIKSKFDLVFSIHCKQLFPSNLINYVKCINIHPGFNPVNRGWYPQVFSIINDLPIGATIHEIDEKIDNGNIIAQEYVRKFAYDTSGSLYKRVINKEIELLDINIEKIIANSYSISTPKGDGNLYLKKDFNELLELNLNEQTSVGKLLNRLRALTHGDLRNAYFIDAETQEKIYVKVVLTPE